jgi:predicted GNAT family N-acyltransferase
MELEIIKHRDILFRDLLRAITVKSFAWPHPIESQVKWIIDNIDDEDEHVFLKGGTKDLAYMNLVRISFSANDTDFMAYGIGNVCAAEKGKGYGRELMNRVNDYLKEKNICGLLYCRDALVPFYKLYGWEEVKREVCEEPVIAEDVHVMTYLAPEKIVTFKYQGKAF